VQAEDGLEEEILIATFNRRQRIEVMKTKALMTAMLNPDEAQKAFDVYLDMALPEYATMRESADDKLSRTFDSEVGKAFVLNPSQGGFSATEVRLDG